ncbi:unnamed protein product [Microthlaspi erraticum]|uniref:Bifunctional inhibitor/plant lipid transfer protein/seed storage helical domain-containing protein n=1 Tax=Microthlaspi erraticum TaxID=1685480 RepID=A0A6D2HIH1_9BRAS|nr:unnamed protein product [Microthlaspi erraticum]
MKIIPLMLIASIIPLTSFPSSIKAARSGSSGSSGGGVRVGGFGSVGGIGGGAGGGGGGGSAGGGGGKNGGAGGKSKSKSKNPGRYRVGIGESLADREAREREEERATWGLRFGFPKPQPGGGDTGPSIVVIPKPPAVEMPKECQEPARACVQEHIIDNAGPPKFGGSCCEKLKSAIPCVCTFLMSKDPKAKNAAYGVLRGCHFSQPICINMPMPQTCSPEVRHCVQVHMYGRAGQPPYRGACCKKFQHSKSCVEPFLKSPDPKLSGSANGVLRGCHFRR